MGKNIKMVKEFIEGIPDSKLEGLPSTVGTIYKTTDFRLDMQGVRCLNQFLCKVKLKQ